MLTNIIDLELVIVMCACFTLAYMIMIQHARFVEHKKRHVSDEGPVKDLSERFAVLPYIVVPACFVGLATFAGLCIADYCASMNYVTGAEGIAMLAIGATIACYVVLDYGLVRHIGNAVYFETIESKFLQAGGEMADNTLTNVDPEVAQLILKLFAKK